MNNGYFTKETFTTLVDWFQVGESVSINRKSCGGMVVAGDVISREGKSLVRSHSVGAIIGTPTPWTPRDPSEAGKIAKLLMKNRQRRRSLRQLQQRPA